MLKIKSLVVQGLNAKDNNVWPVHGTGQSLDRTNYVTSSEIGYCARKVWFDKDALRKSAYSPLEGTTAGAEKGDGWGVMQRGHTAEAWLVENLRRSNIGPQLHFAGDEQVSFVCGQQSGTPDGLIEVNFGHILLEIKSIDPRTSPSNLPRQAHIAQVVQNCELVYANGYEVVGALIVYVDASDYSKMHEFYLTFEDYYTYADDLQAKASKIMAAKDASELPAEGIYLDQCKYCAHQSACSAIVRQTQTQGMKHDKFDEAAKRLFG